MPRPVEICLEELDGSNQEEPFVRCVALPGGEPGLALDREGQIKWMPEDPAACGLWVTADDRLALLRTEDTGIITLERGTRTLEVPLGKPVILLDQDLLHLGNQRLRLHVHGEAAQVRPPERLSLSTLNRLARAAAAAATLALGGATAFAAGAGAPGASARSNQPAPIEVRTRPPAPVPKPTIVQCDITSQRAGGKGPLVIQADCKRSWGLAVGTTGTLYDKKTNQAVQKGSVKITAVNGAKITCEAQNLSKPVSNAILRFYINHW